MDGAVAFIGLVTQRGLLWIGVGRSRPDVWSDEHQQFLHCKTGYRFSSIPILAWDVKLTRSGDVGILNVGSQVTVLKDTYDTL